MRRTPIYTITNRWYHLAMITKCFFLSRLNCTKLVALIQEVEIPIKHVDFSPQICRETNRMG